MDEALWARMLQEKYLKGHYFFDYKLKHCDSRVWKGICSAMRAIRRGGCFKLGNGFRIIPLIDPWVPNLRDCSLRGLPRVNILDIQKVEDLKDYSTNEWNFQLLEIMFEEELVNANRNIKWSEVDCEDLLVWRGNK